MFARSYFPLNSVVLQGMAAIGAVITADGCVPRLPGASHGCRFGWKGCLGRNRMRGPAHGTQNGFEMDFNGDVPRF